MLTLEQLYNLGLSLNTDIFSGIILPENSPLNRTVLVNTIIEKCGLNIPMYEDPYIMTSAVNLWSAKNQYTFEHVGKIFVAQYSPIENKDYYEETTTERDLTDNTSGSIGKTENTEAESSNETKHTGTDTTTDEQTTSAYNSDTYEPDNKNVTTFAHGENIKVDASLSNEKTINTTTDSDKTVDENVTVTSHQHGNIGLSTPFDLQKSEYDLLGAYNPYTFLAGLFENDLTLCIY